MNLHALFSEACVSTPMPGAGHRLGHRTFLISRLSRANPPEGMCTGVIESDAIVIQGGPSPSVELTREFSDLELCQRRFLLDFKSLSIGKLSADF